MQLLYLHHGYFPSLAGAETMLRQVAGAMRQRGHTVRIVFQSRGERVERRISDGLRLIGLPGIESDQLGSILDVAPDIVHVVDAVWPEYLHAGLNLALEFKLPLAITPASAMSTWRDLKSGLDVCREADAVFVLTGAERAQFIECGVLAEKLTIIGQGPHLSGKPDPESFRRAHQITGPMVLFLGRKIRSKGYKLLLAAAAEVWSKHPATQIIFIGPRWDADCEETFAAHADSHVIEIGIVDEAEKHNALAACDILCAPSVVDVFPLAIVEAWACGKPVIVSRFPGAGEIVRHNVDGLIVDPSPGAVAAAIVRLLDDPAERDAMGASGRGKVNERFNWEAVADCVESIYHRLTRKPLYVLRGET